MRYSMMNEEIKEEFYKSRHGQSIKLLDSKNHIIGYFLRSEKKAEEDKVEVVVSFFSMFDYDLKIKMNKMQKKECMVRRHLKGMKDKVQLKKFDLDEDKDQLLKMFEVKLNRFLVYNMNAEKPFNFTIYKIDSMKEYVLEQLKKIENYYQNKKIFVEIF